MHDEMKSILDSDLGERQIHAFLKSNPSIVSRTFGHPTPIGSLFSEFYIGDEFRADFVVLKPHSAQVDIIFIELEPIGTHILKKNDDYTPEFMHAMRQIDTWRKYIQNPTNEAYLRSQLARAKPGMDLLWPDRNEEYTCTAGFHLTDHRVFVSYEYVIVIGRRHNMNDRELQAKAFFEPNHRIEVMTYDRLLYTAQELDRYR